MLFKISTEKFFLVTLALSLLPLPIKAQSITPDGTTATAVTTPDSQNFDIDGGDRAGGNLFHSFGNFSLPTAGSANFLNAPDVQNIINRVTGGNVSDIDGLIRASGSANLFLINPAGIIFGGNARLDIGGSFLGSTADRLTFPDGAEFSATNPQAAPLLTINAPIGLAFRDNPSAIVNRSAVDNRGLQVSAGNNLTLAGGDISLIGGRLTAPGGNINVGGLAAAGQLQINQNGSLSFPDRVTRANVSLQGGVINTTGAGGGTLAITGRNIQIADRSFLRAGIGAGLGASNAIAGDIVLNATDAINISGTSNIQNQLLQGAIGQGGSIQIQSSNLSLSDSSILGTTNLSSGNSGNLTVNVSDRISLSNNSSLFTSTLGTGRAGDISLNANNISLVNGGLVNSFTLFRGNTGNLAVNVGDTLSLDGGIISTIVNERRAEGNAGDINIQTGSLRMTNGAKLQTSTLGIGNAGNIKIDTNNAISLDNSNLSINNVLATGRVGNISINTNNLSLSNNSQLSNTNAFGDSEPGRIDINATETISLDNSNLFNGNISGDVRAGDIKINTRNLFLANNSRLFSTSTFGTGDAGQIEINASDRISLKNTSRIESSSILSQGGGGNISLTTNRLNLADNSTINNSAVVTRGNAGNIDIKANLVILENSQIATISNSGESGNINLQVGKTLALQNNAQISTQARGDSSGANLTINAESVIASPRGNSDLVARVASGSGGNLNINAQQVYELEESQAIAGNQTNDLQANTTLGLRENRLFSVPDNPDVDFGDEAIAISEPIAANEIIAQACSASKNNPPVNNQLTVIVEPESIEKPSTENVIPARGWRINDKGLVELTSYPTPNVGNAGDRSFPNSINCP
jgi:filamentous hemagglutinin family protein